MPFGFSCCTDTDVAEDPASRRSPKRRLVQVKDSPRASASVSPSASVLAEATSDAAHGAAADRDIKIPRTVRTHFAPWPAPQNNALVYSPPTALRTLDPLTHSNFIPDDHAGGASMSAGALSPPAVPLDDQ